MYTFSFELLWTYIQSTSEIHGTTGRACCIHKQEKIGLGTSFSVYGIKKKCKASAALDLNCIASSTRPSCHIPKYDVTQYTK